MKILENYDACYGCSACYSICPVDAITMQANEEGFKYPIIDDAKCIECKACQRACPALHPKHYNTTRPEVYAFMADDEVRSYASSGGVFPTLAKAVLSAGGYVAGAVFREDFSVEHIVTNNPQLVRKMSGSKYLQSDTDNVLKDTKSLLDKGNTLLFSGCPCQIAGLYGFLGKTYKNLITVDLICHGVPSPMVWQRFLAEIAKDRAIKEIDFRYKGLVGWSSTTKIKFDKDEFVARNKDYSYGKAFSSCLSQRKSCSACQFANASRQGDITIGDFWNVNAFNSKLNDKKGISIITLNTEKGKEFVKKTYRDNKPKLFQKIPLSEAQKRNSQLFKPPIAHPGREEFFSKIINNSTIETALENAKTKFDVGLFGIWYGLNYGSIMTNYALYQSIVRLGYKPLFIDIPDMMWKGNMHRSNESIARKFGYKHYAISKRRKSKIEMKDLNTKCNSFVVGSDQLWNYKVTKDNILMFALDFVDSGKRKIAYATSVGRGGLDAPEKIKAAFGTYLKRFDHVSVREDFLVDELQKLYDVKSVQMPDPVFLCDVQQYSKLCTSVDIKIDKPYLAAYILDPSSEKEKVIEHLAEKLGLEYVILPNTIIKSYMKPFRLEHKVKRDLEMEEWLFYMKNSSFVLTDSFHGTCFSILFEKPFFTIRNAGRGGPRFTTLLSKFDLMDRLAEKAADILNMTNYEIDYEPVKKYLQQEQKRGLDWLGTALEGIREQNNRYELTDIIDYRVDALEKKANKASELDKKLEQISKQLQEQDKKLEGYKKSIEQKNKEIEGILNSKSFKVGRALTWAPRKLKDSIKNRKK